MTVEKFIASCRKALASLEWCQQWLQGEDAAAVKKDIVTFKKAIAAGERQLLDNRARQGFLYAALDNIVTAWDSVPDSVQVPDEINDDALWGRARNALGRPQTR